MTGLLKEVDAARRLPPPPMRKTIRKAAGVSLDRLAEELGVHRVTVARWENGSRQPRRKALVAYAELLDALVAPHPRPRRPLLSRGWAASNWGSR
jgi:transcriptional regulator with XRE-family HTH domain